MEQDFFPTDYFILLHMKHYNIWRTRMFATKSIFI